MSETKPTPEELASYTHENLVRYGLALTNREQTAVILVMGQLLLAGFLMVTFKEQPLVLTIVGVLALGVLCFGGRFAWKQIRNTLEFKKTYRKAYDEGQGKLNSIPRNKRFIWQTDEFGDPQKSKKN